jgi:cold shock CspA family protein
MCGRIKFIKADKGYAFVTSEGISTPDCFLHVSNMAGQRIPLVGTRIQFELPRRFRDRYLGSDRMMCHACLSEHRAAARQV